MTTMAQKLPESSGSVVGFHIPKIMEKSDYAELTPELEAIVAEFGHVELLCDMRDFRWEKASAWGADLAFGKEFHGKITKMAIVGDSLPDEALAVLAKPFYAREVKYFSDPAGAWDWLRADAG